MGDSATAMRDPVFYRWHALIDDIFQTFKSSLPRYTVEQVSYQNCHFVFIERINSSERLLKIFFFAVSMKCLCSVCFISEVTKITQELPKKNFSYFEELEREVSRNYLWHSSVKLYERFVKFSQEKPGKTLCPILKFKRISISEKQLEGNSEPKKVNSWSKTSKK